jgi:hypothetical protein
MQSETIVTVTTAAATYDLVDLADVKDELGITDGSKNALLGRYISSASASASQFCNRVFPAETMTEQFWAQRDRRPQHMIPAGLQILQVSRWPIQSVTSVTENGIVLVKDTDFKIDAVNGQLIRLDLNGYPRPWPACPLVVVYVGGFSEIPVDVQDAVIRMVTSRYARKGRDPNLKQRNIPGVIEQSWWIATGNEAGNMSPDIADILENYRVPVVA